MKNSLKNRRSGCTGRNVLLSFDNLARRWEAPLRDY
jgi:hypothetical protein